MEWATQGISQSVYSFHVKNSYYSSFMEFILIILCLKVFFFLFDSNQLKFRMMFNMEPSFVLLVVKSYDCRLPDQ